MLPKYLALSNTNADLDQCYSIYIEYRWATKVDAVKANAEKLENLTYGLAFLLSSAKAEQQIVISDLRNKLETVNKSLTNKVLFDTMVAWIRRNIDVSKFNEMTVWMHCLHLLCTEWNFKPCFPYKRKIPLFKCPCFIMLSTAFCF